MQLPEHVKSYYKSWQDYHNEKVSVTLSSNAVSRIRQLLENSTGNLPMISALIPQPLAETIKSPSPHHGPHDHDDTVNLNSGAWQVEKLLETEGYELLFPPPTEVFIYVSTIYLQSSGVIYNIKYY